MTFNEASILYSETLDISIAENRKIIESIIKEIQEGSYIEEVSLNEG